MKIARLSIHYLCLLSLQVFSSPIQLEIPRIFSTLRMALLDNSAGSISRRAQVPHAYIDAGFICLRSLVLFRSRISATTFHLTYVANLVLPCAEVLAAVRNLVPCRSFWTPRASRSTLKTRRKPQNSSKAQVPRPISLRARFAPMLTLSTVQPGVCVFPDVFSTALMDSCSAWLRPKFAELDNQVLPAFARDA